MHSSHHQSNSLNQQPSHVIVKLNPMPVINIKHLAHVLWEATSSKILLFICKIYCSEHSRNNQIFPDIKYMQHFTGVWSRE